MYMYMYVEGLNKHACSDAGEYIYAMGQRRCAVWAVCAGVQSKKPAEEYLEATRHVHTCMLDKVHYVRLTEHHLLCYCTS